MSSAPPAADSGCLELDELAVIRIGGGASRAFLSRQLTCDLSALAPGHPVFGAWLTPKGRAITLVRVLEAGDGTLRALLPVELAQPVLARLRLFVMRDDVHFAIADDESVAGLAAAAVDAAAPRAFAAGDTALMPLCAQPALALLVGPREAVDDVLRGLDSSGIPRLDRARWHLMLVRAGLPDVAAANSEAFVPQMINLDALGAVSFSKGCYPGQEIVARTQHLGRIKRRTFIGHCDACAPAASPGDALVATGDGEATGRVVLAAAHEAGQDMLAVLPLDAVAAGARFHLGDESGPAVAFSAPPYPLDTGSR